MNGDINKVSSNPAVYFANPSELMTAILTPGTTAGLQPTAVTSESSNTNPISNSEYRLGNGNVMQVTTINNTSQVGYYTATYTATDGATGGSLGVEHAVGQRLITGQTRSGSSNNTTMSESGMPLDQLKHALSQQLEYYFSRYIYKLRHIYIEFHELPLYFFILGKT